MTIQPTTIEFLTTSLTSIVQEIDHSLLQLDGFINQFNNLVVTKQLTITSELGGALIVEDAGTLPVREAELLGRRVVVLDSLIGSKKQFIADSFTQGFSTIAEIKKLNPGFNSEILSKLAEFKQITDKYPH